MLAAAMNNISSSASEGDLQQQDLESLALRLRALEGLLAPSPPKAPIPTNGHESPIEEIPEEPTVAQSPPTPRRGGGAGAGGGNAGSQQSNQATGSLSRRVLKIEDKLWAITRERKPVEEFMQKYKSSNLTNNVLGNNSDRELLTLQAKLELIYAAQDDLEKLARESKEIQNLERCAEIGGLKNVETQYPVLSKLETIHIEQCHQTNDTADKISKLADSYNGLISTLSEVFLSWDSLLAAAEQKVTELERARNISA